MAENGELNPDNPEAAPWPWRVVVEMNDTLGVRVGSNLPSVDATEMLLYRALKAIERDLAVLRFAHEANRAPRIQPARGGFRGL